MAVPDRSRLSLVVLRACSVAFFGSAKTPPASFFSSFGERRATRSARASFYTGGVVLLVYTAPRVVGRSFVGRSVDGHGIVLKKV